MDGQSRVKPLGNTKIVAGQRGHAAEPLESHKYGQNHGTFTTTQRRNAFVSPDSLAFRSPPQRRSFGIAANNGDRSQPPSSANVSRRAPTRMDMLQSLPAPAGRDQGVFTTDTHAAMRDAKAKSGFVPTPSVVQGKDMRSSLNVSNFNVKSSAPHAPPPPATRDQRVSKRRNESYDGAYVESGRPEPTRRIMTCAFRAFAFCPLKPTRCLPERQERALRGPPARMPSRQAAAQAQGRDRGQADHNRRGRRRR
ncbi:hypothetical protein M885DRAFT_127636 [Pelagophyceae sp. CCMP2097]|nr:hypothetical protein M885DRAFT_127636 [Pelagophyceae sp. CCMP2097]